MHRKVALLSLVGGLGCQEAAELPPVQAMAACAVSPLTPVESYDTVEVALAGPVLETGDGLAPDGCFDGSHLNSDDRPPPDADSWWIRVADADGNPWTVGVSFPGLARPFAVDDEIEASWRLVPPQFAATSVGALALRDGTGALQLWIAEAIELVALQPPEGLQLEQGDAIYEQTEDCGTWAAYDLQVGETVIPYGGTAAVGDLAVWHGGYVGATGDSSECMDWTVDRVAVAFTPAAVAP
jgi:hypothetical protein